MEYIFQNQNVQTWQSNRLSNQCHLCVELYMHAAVGDLNVFMVHFTTMLVCATQIPMNHQKYVEQGSKFGLGVAWPPLCPTQLNG